MSSDDIKDLDKWKDEFSQHLIEVIFKSLLMEEQERGVVFSQDIAVTFLARYIGGLIYNALEHKPTGFSGLTGKEQFDYISEQYADLKRRVEDAVAAGFQGAMSTYSKMPVDFYCKIKAVEEPASKLVN